MEIRVNKKENVYFALKVVFTLLIALFLALAITGLVFASSEASPNLMASFIPILVYIVLIILYLFFRKVFIVGYLRGNGVEVTEFQFPDLYQSYSEMARELGIKRLPPLFLIQQGGALNAFAIRFSCRNYIAIYSDLLDIIETDAEVVNFVLAHELGHVKRHHMSKRFWTILGSVVPFLGAAYSRSCEYTCDNIGADLSKEGAVKGLLVLASGKTLYTRIDADKYIESAKKKRGIAVWFAELCSGHPFLPNRIANVKKAF